MFFISGFYKFKKIPNIKKNKKIMQTYFISNGIRGTIIISKEGINGSISAKRKNLDLAINKIKKTFNFILLFCFSKKIGCNFISFYISI